MQAAQSVKAQTQPDVIAFARSLGFDPDPWQERLLRWNGSQLLLNCARQSGKSTVTALLACYIANFTAGSLILLISPSLRQSSELFRKVTDWRLRMGQGARLAEDNRLSCVLTNGSRIVSLPSSEATVRGFSAANLVIFDEAARVDDALYFAMRPMLAVSHGRLIAMSTPFGKRGWWWSAWEEGGADWERIKVTARENPRITRAFLDSERRAMGAWWFDQEYDCEFREGIDQIFDYDSIIAAMKDDVQPLFPLEGLDGLSDAVQVLTA